MKRKIIDLTPYKINPTETIIKQVFYKDEELRFIYLFINNYSPLTASELTKHYNKHFSTNYSKAFIITKINKIENFGLFEKKAPWECTNGSAIDIEINKKHNEWLLHQPISFSKGKRYDTNQYYILNDKGISFVEIVSEMQKRSKGK